MSNQVAAGNVEIRLYLTVPSDPVNVVTNPLFFLFQIHLSSFSCSLTLLLPQVTKTEFLLTMSIQYQPDK